MNAFVLLFSPPSRLAVRRGQRRYDLHQPIHYLCECACSLPQGLLVCCSILPQGRSRGSRIHAASLSTRLRTPLETIGLNVLCCAVLYTEFFRNSQHHLAAAVAQNNTSTLLNGPAFALKMRQVAGSGVEVRRTQRTKQCCCKKRSGRVRACMCVI